MSSLRFYCTLFLCFFFFNNTAPTEIYTLSLHDALPIYVRRRVSLQRIGPRLEQTGGRAAADRRDRKSTRLNSSHRCISYAVFCLKKKKKQITSYVTYASNT